MKHTKHYDQASRKERLATALEDANFYLGDVKPKLVAVLRMLKTEYDRGPKAKVRAARFACAFVGLQGAPATAIIKEVWNAQ